MRCPTCNAYVYQDEINHRCFPVWTVAAEAEGYEKDIRAVSSEDAAGRAACHYDREGDLRNGGKIEVTVRDSDGHPCGRFVLSAAISVDYRVNRVVEVER